MIEVVVGAPFAGKRQWIDREIERRESDGEIGLLALDYTGVYAAIVPGLASVYRDQRVTDSGSARFAGYMLAVTLTAAVERELSGYLAVDSPRRALAALAQTGGSQVVEVTVSQETALRRSQQHVELVKALAPRAADDAAERCRKVVQTYYNERDVLDSVDVRRVQAPELPSDNAIRYAWTAAIRAAKRGDTEKRDKWTAAAKRMLATRGIAA